MSGLSNEKLANIQFNLLAVIAVAEKNFEVLDEDACKAFFCIKHLAEMSLLECEIPEENH